MTYLWNQCVAVGPHQMMSMWRCGMGPANACVSITVLLSGHRESWELLEDGRRDLEVFFGTSSNFKVKVLNITVKKDNLVGTWWICDKTLRRYGMQFASSVPVYKVIEVLYFNPEMCSSIHVCSLHIKLSIRYVYATYIWKFIDLDKSNKNNIYCYTMVSLGRGSFFSILENLNDIWILI